MILYHYRSIKSALLEIGKGTFHFAAREELNDPIEGYLRVFWQGDTAAWEGLLRNYVCSLSQAVDLYLLRGDEDMLRRKSLIVDLHRYDDVPLGEKLRELGEAFLAEDDIRDIAAFYGEQRLKVREKELRLLLRFIHGKALASCIRKNRDCKTMPASETEALLRVLETGKNISYPIKRMRAEKLSPEHRAAITRHAEESLEDLLDAQYVQIGFSDETFLYGNRREESGRVLTNDSVSEARQRRNWLAVATDFPKIYVEQLKEMLYPESFVVCFSGKSDDSAMWGNYADHHQGVCLMYETDEDNSLTLRGKQSCHLKAKRVCYGGEIIERNFFETFGRLTYSQIKTWLTGADGSSELLEDFKNGTEWRSRYWDAYTAKTYRKLEAWRHEDEYRLAVENSFGTFSGPESRNLRYEPKCLCGVIFGVRTSEYDKKRIVEALREHAEAYGDLAFYQAEYDDEAQSIRIRKKSLWRIRDENGNPPDREIAALTEAGEAQQIS